MEKKLLMDETALSASKKMWIILREEYFLLLKSEIMLQ